MKKCASHNNLPEAKMTPSDFFCPKPKDLILTCKKLNF